MAGRQNRESRILNVLRISWSHFAVNSLMNGKTSPDDAEHLPCFLLGRDYANAVRSFEKGILNLSTQAIRLLLLLCIWSIQTLYEKQISDLFNNLERTRNPARPKA